MFDYIYDHLEEMKLIICCSDGSKYNSFVHSLVQIEMDYTYKFIDALRRSGRTVNDIEPQVCHVLVSTLFTSFFEFVVHDMPRDEAAVYFKDLRNFYTAGWIKLMGL